jgi:teichuronic acid exporter
MASTIKTAVFWNTIEVIGNQLIGVVITILLARLLLPEDFGLIGMVAVITMVSSVIIDGGIAAAIIQKQSISQVELSTLFFINILLGGMIVFLVLVFSPSVARFFEEPQLVGILNILSLAYFLGSLQVIQYGLLAKKMEFKSIGKIRLLAQIVAGLIAVFLALWGVGVWALVAQNIVSVGVSTLLFWLFGKWKPSLVFDLKVIRHTFQFSGYLLVSSLINQIVDNLYFVLIAKFFPTQQLGFYYQANRIQRIPAIKIQQIAQQSTFPEFSRLSAEKEKLVVFFYKSLSNSLFINMLAMGLLAINAENMVLWLLTDKWEASIPYIQWLCMASLFLPVLALSRNFILGMGDSKIQLRVILINKFLLVSVAIFTVQYGIMGLIYGQVFVAVIFVVTYFFFIRYTYRVSMKNAWILLGKYTSVTVISLAAVFLLKPFIDFHHFISILIWTGTFGVFYLALMALFDLQNEYIQRFYTFIKIA